MKAKKIQKIIAGRIISGDLRAGSKIKEKALAEEFDISRGPIREALNALRQEGLIDMVPNRGAFVNSLSLKEAMDLYDVRAGLAHTAGRLLPYRISDAQVASLKEMHGHMDRLISENDLKGFYHINKEFHHLLFVATGNKALIEMSETVERRLSLYLQREMSNSNIIRESNSHHMEIVEKISIGNPDGVSVAFEHHILVGKQRLFEQNR